MKRIVLAALLALGPLAGVSTAAPAAVTDPVQSVNALRLELAKAQSAVQPLYAQRQKLEDEVARLASSIDSAKKQPEGVARDRDLQALLAQSKDKTDQLDQVQAQLRWREPGLAALRRRVLSAIDVALDGGGKALPDATRLDLEHLRVTTVAMMASPALPVQVVRDPNAAIDPLDGPRELREKADLLRDSGDKLRREVKRIAGRLDSVERRRHLRERSGALDEDLFGEATSSRRVARVGEASASTGTSTSIVSAPAANTGTGGSQSTSTGATSNPGVGPGGSTPVNNGGAGLTGSSTDHSSTTTLRNLVDPATLEELERADSIDDTDRQARALKKAQTELESLANELDRRAKALDGRAAQLKQQK